MSADAGALAERLIAWQRQHGRHSLPWQQTQDPYRVWLSEIMLQQTQVGTVLGYYQRFLARFPDVQALAAAPLDEVLALWAGLGYYSRARNLHRCAQAVVAEHGGRFPAHSTALAELPGIGRSTAAAIAAFCFGERVAILDGNVKRVLSRVLAFGEDLVQARHEKALWLKAGQLLPRGPGIEAYTQGLMDLGAGLCSTRAPQCEACPLANLCIAHAGGQPEAYPVRVRKLKRQRRELAWLWLTRGESVWLVQRPATGIWAGLWSLPEFASVAALEHTLAGEAVAERRKPLPLQGGLEGGAKGSSQLGLEVGPSFSHALTHLEMHITPVQMNWPQAWGDAVPPAWCGGLPGRWAGREDLSRMGLPAPLAKLLAQAAQPA